MTGLKFDLKRSNEPRHEMSRREHVEAPSIRLTTFQVSADHFGSPVGMFGRPAFPDGSPKDHPERVHVGDRKPAHRCDKDIQFGGCDLSCE